MGGNQPDDIEGMCSSYCPYVLRIAWRKQAPQLLSLWNLNKVTQVRCRAQCLAWDTFSKRIFMEK